MPEARTPRLLRSRLHPHQAKALQWMLDKERERDVEQALAEQQRQQQQQAAMAAAAAAEEEGAGKGKGKAKGKKKAAAAAGTGVSSSTVFFYEKRVDPASGRTVYYKCVQSWFWFCLVVCIRVVADITPYRCPLSLSLSFSSFP